MQSTRQKGAVSSGLGSASGIGFDSALCHEGNNMFVHCLIISDTIELINGVAQSRSGINPFCWLSQVLEGLKNNSLMICLHILNEKHIIY